MQKCGPWLVQSAVAALVHVQLSNFLTIKLKTVTPRCLATTELQCQTWRTLVDLSSISNTF